MEDEFKILIGAEFDRIQAEREIKKQLPILEKDIRESAKFKFDVELSDKEISTAAKRIAKKLQSEAPKIKPTFDIDALNANIKKAESSLKVTAKKWSSLFQDKGLTQQYSQLMSSLENIKEPSQLKKWNVEAAIFRNNVKMAGKDTKALSESAKIKPTFDVKVLDANIKKAESSLKVTAKKWSALFNDKDLSLQYNQLLSSLDKIKEPSELKKWNTELTIFKNNVKVAGKDTKALNDVPKIKPTFDVESLNASIKKAESSLGVIAKKWSALFDDKDLTQQYNQLMSSLGEIKEPSDLKKWNTEAAIFRNNVKMAGKDTKALSESVKVKPTFDASALNANIKKAESSLKVTGKKWSALFKDKDLSLQYSQLMSSLGDIKDPAQLKKWNAEAAVFRNNVKMAGKDTNTFSQTLINNGKKFAEWLIAGNAFMTIYHQLRQGADFSATLDEALTNINYTMDVTSKRLKEIGSDSINMGKNLHTSSKNVLEAVTLYANAKESADSILNKSEPTIMLSNTTGMTPTETADILQGTMEQFDLTEDDMLHISDVVQKVSQSMAYDFSRGVKELSEGIKTSGNVAKDAGYDLESYTALIGNLIEKTRQSGSELGRSLRTMMVRTSRASLSALAGGEVTQDEISNAEKALGRVGIKNRSDLDTFRDFDDILLDIYEKLDSMSEVDLSAIAYEVGSTRQVNVFKQMIKSYGDYLKLSKQAHDADGTTLENQEKYADSLKAKYADLTVATESLYNTVISSDALKVIASSGKGVISTLDSIIKKLGLFPTILAGLGAYQGFKGKGLFNLNIDEETGKLKNYGKSVTQTFENIKQNKLDLGKIWDGYESDNLIPEIDKKTASTQLKSFNDRLASSGLSEQDFLKQNTDKTPTQLKQYIQSTTQAERTTKGYVKSVKKARTAQIENGEAIQITGIKSKAASIGIKALSTAMNMVVWMAIAEGISWAIKGLDNLVHAQEKASEKAIEANEKYEDTKSQLEDINTEIETTSQRIDELNNKDSLSIVEQDELTKLQEQNAELKIQKQLLDELAEQEKVEANNAAYKSITKKSKSIDTIDGSVDRIDKVDSLIIQSEDLRKSSEKVGISENEKKRYEKQVNAYKSETAKLIEELMKESDGLVKGMNPETDTLLNRLDEVFSKYTAFSKTETLTDKLKKSLGNSPEIKEYIDSLSDEDIDVLLNIEDIGSYTLNDLPKLISNAKEEAEALSNAFNLESFNKDIDKVQSSYSTLTNAAKEYNKYGAYSVDTLQSLFLLDSKYLQMLVNQDGQFAINGTSLQNDVQSKLNDAKSKIRNDNSIDPGMVSAIESVLDGIASNVDGALQGYDKTEEAAKKAEEAAKKIEDAQKKATDAQKKYNKTVDDTNKKLEDLDENRSLNNLKTEIEQNAIIIERFDSAIESLDGVLGTTFENDYDTKISITSRQLELSRAKAYELGNEYQRLAGIEASTANEANEIASRIQETGQSLREAKKASQEYTLSLIQLNKEKVASMAQDLVKSIEDSSSLFDNNLSKMEKGGLGGFSFDLLPTIPEDAIENQKNQNEALIEEEQRYREEIDEIRQNALALEKSENETAYVENKKELQQALIDAKQDLNDTLADVQSTISEARKSELSAQLVFNQTSQKQQKDDTTAKKEETQDFSNQEKSIITDLNVWNVRNPLIAPGLDKPSWEGMINEAEQYAEKIKNAFSPGSSAFGNSFLANRSGNISPNLQKLLSVAEQYASADPSTYRTGENKVKWNNYDGQAWCQSAISGVFKEAGLSNLIKNTASTVDAMEEFKSNGQFIDAKSGYTPKVGDVLYRKSTGGYNHVGLVVEVSSDGKTVKTFEGNMGSGKNDRMGYTTYNVDDSRIYGYGLPAYAKGTNSHPGGLALVGDENLAKGSSSPSPESILHPDGTFEIVGAAGAEIRDIEPNATVLTTKQTKEILNNDSLNHQNKIRRFANGYNNKDITALSGATAEDIDALIQQYCNSDSILKPGMGKYFIEAQNASGIDAVALFSIAAHESGYFASKNSSGNPSIGASFNNFFGYGAIDSNPRGGAAQYSYSTIEEGIVEIAKKIANYPNKRGQDTLYKIEHDPDGTGYTYASDKQWDSKIGGLLEKHLNFIGKDLGNGYNSSNADNLKVNIDTNVNNSSPQTSPQPTQEEVWANNFKQVGQDALNTFDKQPIEQISSFRNLANIQEETSKNLDGVIKSLNGDSSKLPELANQAWDYLDAITNKTSDITIAEAKYNYDKIKAQYDAQLAYYDERSQADDVTADELQIYKDLLKELSEDMGKISDQYVKQIEAITDYRINAIKRKLSVFDSDLSINENAVSDLKESYEDIDTYAGQQYNLKDTISLLESSQDIYRKKKSIAHEARLEADYNLQNDPLYSELNDILKQTGFNIDDMYNPVDGEFNKSYDDFIAILSEYNRTDLTTLFKGYAEEVQTAKQGWIDSDEELKQSEKDINKLLDQQVDLKIEAYKEINQAGIDSLTKQKERQDLLNDGLQSYYDTQNQIREAQNQINSELKSSKHLSEWLDPETRKKLFNDEDYSELSSVLNDINSQVTSLHKKYQNDISNLSADEWYKQAEITSEYERQLSTKLDEYNVAKQRLDLAKKQTEMDNIARERNTRVLVAGHWVNVADPEALYNASQELSTAENALDDQLTISEQNQTVQQQQRLSDGIQKEIELLEYRNENIDKMNKAEQRLFAEHWNATVESIDMMLQSARGFDEKSVWNSLPSLGLAYANSSSKDSGSKYTIDADHMQQILDVFEENVGRTLTDDEIGFIKNSGSLESLNNYLLSLGGTPISQTDLAWIARMETSRNEKINAGYGNGYHTSAYWDESSLRDDFIEPGIANGDYGQRFRGLTKDDYSIIDPSDLLFPSNIAGNIANFAVDPIQFMKNNLIVPTNPSQYTQPQNTTNTVENYNYHFDNLNITEKIDNATEFVQELTTKGMAINNITKNKRR